jgi:hypothetical protein
MAVTAAVIAEELAPILDGSVRRQQGGRTRLRRALHEAV